MKKLLALTMAGAMALSLAACGGSTTEETSEATSDAASTETTETAEGEEAAAGDVTLNWAVWDLESTAYWEAMANATWKATPASPSRCPTWAPPTT